jgi:hypothetical protein
MVIKRLVYRSRAPVKLSESLRKCHLQQSASGRHIGWVMIAATCGPFEGLFFTLDPSSNSAPL